jgi:glycosyltransferase involved in cell wall biosynthesis
VARASILTLEPGLGGVPALARTVYQLLTASGHTPHVVYRASEEVPTSSRWAALRFFLAAPPVRRLIKEDMNAVAVADYPVPPRYYYHLLRLAGSALKAPIAAVVSGSSHVGLPLALARRPYILWVATLYDEELKSRAAVGDEWAERFLGHRDWPALQAQEQLVYERASLILGLSPNTTAQIADRWPHIQSKLSTVLYPVNTDHFHPGAGPSDPPYLLLTARIRDPRKNVHLLLRAFARVRSEFSRLRLVIVGDHPLPATRTLAAELGLGESVVFPGHVPASEFVSLYQRATLFVFPSLQEGLGISVLEAMACGLPVLSTRCGGPEGIVDDGVTGVMTPNNDELALAHSLRELLPDPDRMRAMGMAGRRRAERLFARARIESQLRAAFAEAFSGLF